MREILSGRSSPHTQSNLKERQLEYVETKSSISSAGSLCEEPAKYAVRDDGYFSEKPSSSGKEPFIGSRQKGYGLLGSSLITAKGKDIL